MGRKLTERLKEKADIVMRDLVLFKIGAIARVFKRAGWPVKPGEPVLIHFGCGLFNDKRYINVDSRKGWHIHVSDSIENVRALFAAEYADLIYACHVLEHVSHQDLLRVLKDLRTTLKIGGILRISVPNFDVILQIYQEQRHIGDIVEPLMGGQGYPENYHCSIFNEDYLKLLFLQAGFREVRLWEPKKASYHNFDDWSGKAFHMCGKDWRISLNLEAVK